MESTYRSAVSGKRQMPRSGTTRKGEKRRLIQLLVSLGLFLLVYMGQGLLPVQAESWGKFIAADTDFGALLDQLRQKDGSSWINALLSREENIDSGATESDKAGVGPSVAVKLLGQTSGHGLVYLYEHGIPQRLWNLEITQEPETEPEPEPEIPEVVTAVAQAYDESGAALPSNVSFLYYELGLRQTTTPVFGVVSSAFGYRTSPINGEREFHLALDIAAETGTDIFAYADGEVRYIGESDEFGLYFMIDHDNGVSTFYAHCSKLFVRKGDVVTCGQTVALVGETGNVTGPHLHFTLLKDGIRLDPAYYVELSK